MSNKFYESGLFAAAHPDIMFDIKSCSPPISNKPYRAYKFPTDNLAFSPASYPNDTYFDQQWNLHNPDNRDIDINYLAARNITTGSPDIKIAVIDLGIAYFNNPDLDMNEIEFYYCDGSDVYEGESITKLCENPLYEHALWCLGVIKAKTDNNEGIASIAPNCSVMSIGTTISSTGNAYKRCESVATAFNTAMEKDASVISCSFYISGSDDAGYELVEDAIDNVMANGRNGKGCVVVFAAGNTDTSQDVHYPANYNFDLIVVGAMDKSGDLGTISAFGSELDILAPGEEIYTTNTGNYDCGLQDNNYSKTFHATSAACPQVAGAAALILSVEPALTREEVARKLFKSAKKLSTFTCNDNTHHKDDCGTWCPNHGYGLLDIYGALNMSPDPIEPDPKPTIPDSLYFELLKGSEFAGSTIQAGKVIEIGMLKLDAANITLMAPTVRIKQTVECLKNATLNILSPADTLPKVVVISPDSSAYSLRNINL